jgi:hypothetical protein
MKGQFHPHMAKILVHYLANAAYVLPIFRLLSEFMLLISELSTCNAIDMKLTQPDTISFVSKQTTNRALVTKSL